MPGWLLAVLNLLGMGGGPVTADAAAENGGTFRRYAADAGRVLRRAAADAGRVLKGYHRMADVIQRDTVVKDAAEVISYAADFQDFPEARAGETLTAASVPAVSGITLAGAAVTAAARDFIPAALAVEFTASGGTAGTTYTVEVFGTFSGGSVRCVKADIVVE